MFDFDKIPQFRQRAAAALEFYKENGFHVEHGVWTPEQVANVNDAALGLSDRDENDFRPLMHPHRKSDVFLDALRNPLIVDLMECLLEGDISGLQTEYFFGAPGTKGFAMHQDNFYLEAGQNVFGSAWSPMADVSPENGGVFFFPGTHLEPVLPTRQLTGGSGPNQDPNAANEECIVPDKYKPIDVRLPAGSTAVFHGHLVHGSHQNNSSRFRNVLLTTFIRKGEKFRAGYTAKRTEISVKTAS